MTRDDITRMAREAGDSWGDTLPSDREFLERFAGIVAAHVRETEFKPDWNNYRQGLFDGAAAERQACAKVADEFWVFGMSSAYIADAIRARGDA